MEQMKKLSLIWLTSSRGVKKKASQVIGVLYRGVITLSAIKSNPLIRKSARLGEGLASSANAGFRDT